MHPRPFRPTSITTLAVLNLVFAGLGVIGLLFTWATYFGGMSLGPRNIVVEVANRSPEYMSFLHWSLAIGALGITVLSASGIGLLKMRLWGRKLALAYGVGSILVGIVSFFVMQHYLIAPLSQSHEPAAAAGATAGYAGGIVGLAYPIVLLAFMRKRSVVAALQVANEPLVPPARVI